MIDNLAPGGAQRQLATLGVGLRKRGHAVRFLVYHPQDHFLPLLQEAGIPRHVIPACSRWRRLLAVRRELSQGWQDVVLAFLEIPCLCAELARISRPRWGLVAGERSAAPSWGIGLAGWLRQAHRLADCVVTNSHTNRLMLHQQQPFLKNKLTTIYNIVDFEAFRPTADPQPSLRLKTDCVCRIVVAASYQANKNLSGVARALLELRRRRFRRPVMVDWYGGMPADASTYNRAQAFIAEHGLTGILNLHPPTRKLASEFATASAVGLFSFCEGLPNVICEGMASGKVILLSDVCDAGNLVREGKNGFLCDPASPESIAHAIGLVAALTIEDRQHMGTESRRMAEQLFAEDIVLDRYEQVLAAAARHENLPAGCIWPADVPDSAWKTSHNSSSLTHARPVTA